MTAVMMLLVGVVFGAVALKAVRLIPEFVFTAAGRVWKAASVSAAALTRKVASVGAADAGRGVRVNRALASVKRSARGSVDIRRPIGLIALAADGYMRRWVSLRGRIWSGIQSRVVRIDASALMRKALFGALAAILAAATLFGVALVHPDVRLQHAAAIIGYVGIAAMVAMYAAVITAALVIVAVAPMGFWRGVRRRIVSDVDGQVERIRALVADVAAGFAYAHPEDVEVLRKSLRPMLLMWRYEVLKRRIRRHNAVIGRIADMGYAHGKAARVLNDISASMSCEELGSIEFGTAAVVCEERSDELLAIAHHRVCLLDELYCQSAEIFMELTESERALNEAVNLTAENETLKAENDALKSENQRLHASRALAKTLLEHGGLMGEFKRAEEVSPVGYGGRVAPDARRFALMGETKRRPYPPLMSDINARD